ncbi:annexin A1-like [Protopterus annectens]|uniref:annexin A1-like n=1 Tax=Protopterus annectens TaxID=7888 RepID=UPI001CFA6C12|nr:annexin A1-like [Protopterus annectens]
MSYVSEMTIYLVRPNVNTRGATVKPYANFNQNTDAADLEKALKAKGVDEGTIIDIMTKRTSVQRQRIKSAYEQLTGKSLEDGLKKGLSGNLQEVMLALLKTPAQYDAYELRAAMKGLGTDEGGLIEILASRTNKEIKEINQVYATELKRDLAKDIASDTSGDFKKVLVILAEGSRSEDTHVNDQLADADARALYDAGERRKGTELSTFTEILTKRSIPQLQRTFQLYKKHSENDMNKVVELELKGDIKKCFAAIVKCVENKSTFFAERLYKAMKGSGTRHKDLIRILVSRCEIDLSNIKDEYKKLYGTTLHQAILAEGTKGEYETALLALCGRDN